MDTTLDLNYFHNTYIISKQHLRSYIKFITEQFLQEYFGFEQAQSFNLSYMVDSSLTIFEKNIYSIYINFVNDVDLYNEWIDGDEETQQKCVQSKIKFYNHEFHTNYFVLRLFKVDDYHEINNKYNRMLVDYLFDAHRNKVKL